MAKNKGIAKKIVAGALALVVAAGGVSLLGYASRDNNGNWFGNLWTDNGLDNGNGNGGPIISDGESNGMLLSATAIPLNSYEEYGVSPLAENAYSLSVTYTPSDTTFKKTNFTVAFKNPSSTWATGKKVADYVTVTATGDTTATLSVLKPFSEQIIVTATHNKNTSIKATTTVDYVCTTLNNISMWDTPACDDIYFEFSGWSNGTLNPDTAGTITFVYDVGASFVSAASAAGFTVNRYYTKVLPNVADDSEDSNHSCDSIESIYRQGILSNYNSLNAAQKLNYNQFLGRQFANHEDNKAIGKYGFSYSRKYNGVTYSTYDIVQDSNANWKDYCYCTDFAVSFYVSATSMSANNSSIIAG